MHFLLFKKQFDLSQKNLKSLFSFEQQQTRTILEMGQTFLDPLKLFE